MSIKGIRILQVLVIFFILDIVGASCHGQNSEFQYQKIPQSYQPTILDLRNYRNQADSIKVGTHDITQNLPGNFVTDASVDYTDFLQEAINNYNTVVFPDFPILINKKGLALRSNTTLIFPEHSILILAANAEQSYSMLSIRNVENINLYFLN